jgi:hypothetical protein
MKANPDDNSITMTAAEARKMSNALADVLCWFSGFQAARRRRATLPPGIDDLRSLNLALKELNWKEPQ